MDEYPTSDHSSESAGVQRTGGVDVNADQVSIGGDVVGHDKVTKTELHVDTGSGAYVAGNVTVEGQGKFVGRDDNSVTVSDSPGAIVAEEVTVKRYLTVFRSVQQVITFLLIIIAVVAIVAYVAYRASLPPPMTGDFNIAVAQFEEVPASDRPTLAPIISSGLANYLDSVYKADNLGLKVQVGHDKIQVVHSSAEADVLAKQVKANLVIYGTVSVLGEDASVTPKFWVYDALKNDAAEMIGTGQHQLEYPFQFAGSEVLDIKSGVNTALQRRANILIGFTQALVYRKTSQYKAARDAVQQAINEAEAYSSFKGKETLYLIAADIARLDKDLLASRQFISESLTINPNYARAYIALANIFYEQHDFAQAFDYYDRATRLSDLPDGAHIIEKANLGLGNIFSYQFQSQPANSALAELAVHHFGIVVEAYQQSKDTSISELAALAYYGQGVIYQIQNEKDQARQMLEKALSISDDPLLRQKAQDRLSQL